MKLTVEEVYNISQGLSALLDKELPTSVAFSIQRNFKKVGEEVDAANKVKNKLADKYKDHIDDNGYFKKGKKKEKEEYNKELKELYDETVEIELNPIKLSDLGEYIKPRTVGLIEKIIEEEK